MKPSGDVSKLVPHLLVRDIPLTIVQDPQAINELFRGLIPKGVTPIGNKLEELLQEYFSIIEPLHNRPVELKKIKPINFLIITDGYPSMPKSF